MNVNVRPLRRKTRREQVIKAVRDLELPSGVRSSLSGLHPPKAVKSGATAVVAATAASAAISAVRRRIETTGSDE
jgi:predicted nicotinamide N-methyase